MGFRKKTPTIAGFFKKKWLLKLLLSGEWHLSNSARSYPMEHGFDEMKGFAAFCPAAYYTYNDSWSRSSIRGFLPPMPKIPAGPISEL